MSTSGSTFGARPRRAAARNASSGDALERIGRERPERLLGPGGPRRRCGRLGDPRVEHLGRVLERLALEQPREQEVALLEAQQLLVDVDVVAAREQPPRLELDERRRDEQELGGAVEVDPLHLLDLGAEDVDDPGERDLPEIDLFLEDQVQEEVERAFEDRRRDLVRHAGQSTRRESQVVVRRGIHQAKRRPRR